MKKTRVIDLLLGFTLIEAKTYDSRQITDILFKAGIAFKTISITEDKIIIRCACGEKRIKALLDGVVEYQTKSGGAMVYLLRQAHRTGLFVGVILCTVIIFLSSMLIWDIKVEGNQGLSDDYILDLLVDYGLKKGKFRQSVDLDKLHQQVLLDNGCIGWLRVNFRGSVAVVEVIEYKSIINDSLKYKASNLVSTKDALILSVTTTEGISAVKAGDTVRMGELLIGGICDSNIHGYTLKNAEGTVIGEICDKFQIKIPYKSVQKSYTGVTFTEKSIEILGKSIKLSKNSGNYGDNYDIITKKKRLEPFNMVKLPIELSLVTYNEYENREVFVSEEQAKVLAETELSKYLKTISELGDVVSLRHEISCEDDGVVLDCTIYRTENICKRVPLSLSS